MNRFFLILLLAVLTGCSSKPFAVDHPEKYSARGSNEVYVVSHGWHTGFVIPSEKIYQSIPALKERFGDSTHIEFGWGDKGFYQASEITTGLTIRAIFWPTESVVHAVSVPERVESYFQNSEVKKICLSENELDSLIAFISNSFYRDSNNNILALKKGLYGNSQFYKGMGDYYLTNTCNKWTANGLKSIGMEISPNFKLTAGSIMSYLESSNSMQTITPDIDQASCATMYP